jgi:hypothetical protein
MKRIYTPEETRQSMIEQGLDPECIKRIMETTVKLHHENFLAVGKMLTIDERIEKHIDLLQAELLLSIVSRACFIILFFVKTLP